MLERALAGVLAGPPGGSWEPVRSRDPGPDLVSADGKEIIEVKERMRGRRDFTAAVTQLGLYCQRVPGVRRAHLVLWHPGLSERSLRRLWSELGELLVPEVASRLGLVCAWPDGQLLIPDDPRARRLSDALRVAVSTGEGPRARMDRSYEVLKLLLLRYFLGQGKIRISELQAQTGLSYPTVARDLASLDAHIKRHSDRSVELTSFPSAHWVALRALATKLRATQAYEDATGRSANIERLVRRLAAVDAPHAAFGGVIGARHWKADIDIEGTPRIDLCVHAPDGHRDMAFLSRVDPALEPTDDASGAVLVVHTLLRAEPHFESAADGLRIADPVEVLLDLYELRLQDQANELQGVWRRSK